MGLEFESLERRINKLMVIRGGDRNLLSLHFHVAPYTFVKHKVQGDKITPMHYIEIEGLRTFISRNIVVYRRDDYVISCMQKRRKTQAKKHLNFCKNGKSFCLLEHLKKRKINVSIYI